MDGNELPELISEEEAYEKYANLLEAKELRLARQQGKLGFYKRKKKILYRVDELLDFINNRLNESYKPPSTAHARSPASSAVFDIPPDLEKAATANLRRATWRTSGTRQTNPKRRGRDHTD